ncbi:single-stranded-DNA-specific exonuclease RecJ [Thiobacter aerophilum]|uniref:Single-stranded-DNA-specific exonuclease RecJ n=1 Tax=Thiobacter aerophilum TaxID=3121275 RepID=A0ABV0EFD8_9BURK
MTRITVREAPPHVVQRLCRHGLPPLLARLYAARGIEDVSQLEPAPERLLPPQALTHAAEMARRLADAIAEGKRLLIIADYDADGATACAVALRALRAFGAQVDYLVPNRFEYGYGLTPEIVRLAAQRAPDILITVDNGIASHAGVAQAKRLGMEVFITDHHLPAAGGDLPDAAVIVNPNQPGCGFPSKHLAGVGVIFYVMLALRAELRKRGAFALGSEPNLGRLLDLVALGTVADVVKLDDNNRRLVREGLSRIRKGAACVGIDALFRVAQRAPSRAAPWDLGFVLGPRLNAAGRLTDMSLGIELLTTDDAARALLLAQQLDTLNRERREIEADMQDTALAALEQIQVDDNHSLVLFDPSWHQGVIGILASRLKEKFHRPAIAFAPGVEGELKGSGRSIAGFHLRDALDLVAKRHPTLLRKFGGHAMAAGLSIAAVDFPRFAHAFETVARELIPPHQLTRTLETDGSLPPEEASLKLARRLGDEVWGQGFPQPTFFDRFQVQAQRIVGETHTKLTLARAGRRFEAMLFFRAETLPEEIEAVYRLDVNHYNGTESLQLILEHWQAA